MKIDKLVRYLWFPLALGAAFAAWQPLAAPQLPPLSRSMAEQTQPALFEATLLPAPTSAVHSSSLVNLPNGDRLMFWFGGSREGATDVAIWQTRYHAGAWSVPQAIMRPEIVRSAEWRYVKKVGNPLAVRLTSGDIQLFFVTVSFGGWAGSSLNTIRSHDGGQTWSKAQKLITSPFLNISTLVRTHAVRLADGGFYLPVYHEFLRKFPELLRFDREGQLLDKSRLSHFHGLLQPTLAQLGEQKLICMLRDARGQWLYSQESHDAGRSWSDPSPMALINRDSSGVVANLPDGRLLAVFNDGEHMREQLALADSSDGAHWQHLGWLEHRPDSGEEYSYPAITVEGDTVDVSYTWKRQQIKHVRFNLSWLNAQRSPQ